MSERSTKLGDVLNGVDPKLARVFLPWAIRHPRYLMTFIRLIDAHKRTKCLREKAMQEGVKVPPFLILSITSRCNLSCTGCYATAVGLACGSSGADPLDREQWRKIISEASELGVFGFVIAGGETFLFPGLLELCEEFKDRFFIIVTNGTAIVEEDFRRLKRLSNVAVIVSVEGGKEVTDERRGRGVYETAFGALERLNKSGVLTGVSATITRLNFEHWMDEEQLDKIVDQGVRLLVLIEYIPTSELASPENKLMLTKEEREKFRTRILSFRATKPVYIVHSPGDEEYFGGCVSAGRGFAHVTPGGDLTPCPVSNVATHNLTTSSLREGLASPLFEEIREKSGILENGETPCALFAHPKEVEEIAKSVGAYRTSG